MMRANDTMNNGLFDAMRNDSRLMYIHGLGPVDLGGSYNVVH